jgi:hypothetical protein
MAAINSSAARIFLETPNFLEKSVFYLSPRWDGEYANPLPFLPNIPCPAHL